MEIPMMTGPSAAADDAAGADDDAAGADDDAAGADDDAVGAGAPQAVKRTIASTHSIVTATFVVFFIMFLL